MIHKSGTPDNNILSLVYYARLGSIMAMIPVPSRAQYISDSFIG